ncbi:hypothetical protein PHET_10618 [Paragonimus heterotremus]|uniref:Uncharacterized protein n=1 Tax=Paragonimus heterotremus TaxID=100268 RepID=A0A8J4WCS0_9TREM|nr:hypothetical protein PHET_10618 [Paragonimus heterotremus]
MILYTLLFCTLMLTKCELTQEEKDKTLCFHNIVRQITSNCESSTKRKVNSLVSFKRILFGAYISQLYYILRNVTKYYGENVDSGLPVNFYRLKFQLKTFSSNIRYYDFFAQPGGGEGKCLYHDHSLSFWRCNVDTPCNTSSGFTCTFFNVFHLLCLILVIIET